MIDYTDVRMTKQQTVENGVQINKLVDVFYIASDKELLISITVGKNSPRTVLNCVNQYIFYIVLVSLLLLTWGVDCGSKLAV